MIELETSVQNPSLRKAIIIPEQSIMDNMKVGTMSFWAYMKNRTIQKFNFRPKHTSSLSYLGSDQI